MAYFIFFLILLSSCFLIPRIPFIKKSGLGTPLILCLYLLKITAGLALGWISYKYSGEGNDYWTLNREGIIENKLLLSNPEEFFSSIFYSPYDHYGSFFGSVGSYWNDLKNNIIIKTLAVLNLVTGGNYYINSLFFNFFGFFGHVALFRVFYHLYPARKWVIIAGSFLLPSMLYFSSGIQKDCIIFTMLGLLIYALYFIHEKYSAKRVWLIIISSLLILLIRNHVFVVIIPALLACMLSYKKIIKKPFLITYTFVLLLLFVSSQFAGISPVKVIASKQQDFLELPVASSQLPVDTLDPNFSTLIKSTPQAVENVFLQPYPWKYSNPPLVFLGIEGILYLLLFGWFLLFTKKHNPHPIIWFCIFTFVPLLLFAGYIVPNAGSIVRYRGIYYPLAVLPMLCAIFSYNKK